MGVRQLAGIPYRLGRYAWRVWKDARPAAKRNNISVFRIVREQIVLKLKNEIRPDEYYHFGLENPAMPWEEKLTYVSKAQHGRHWYVFTPERYHHIFKNKLVFGHLFRSMGFPVAELYGTFDPAWGRTAGGVPLRTAADIASWMASSDIEGVVFKPVESAEGRMVLVMSRRKPGDRTKFVDLSGEEYSPEQLVNYFSDPERLREAYPEYATPLRTMLVEERLHGHPELQEFAPHTLCCARITTLTTLHGGVEVLETVMKLTDAPSGVDNQIQGSVGIFVDPDTGVLGTGRLEFDPGYVRRESLPGTGKRFTGFRLRMWNEVLELAREAAAAFPEAHTVGWDVGITDRGPFLVEGNAAHGQFQPECQKGLMQGTYTQVLEQLMAQQEGK